MKSQFFSSRQREPLSNIKANYQISPFLKQLKSFEQRFNSYKPKLKPLKKTHNKAPEDQVMECVNHIIKTGTTIDCFQTDKLKPYEEYEQDYYRERHMEVLDRVRTFRVRSSNHPQRIETSCHSRFNLTELTSRQMKSTTTQKCRQLQCSQKSSKQNQKKPEINFLSYKRTTKL